MQNQWASWGVIIARSVSLWNPPQGEIANPWIGRKGHWEDCHEKEPEKAENLDKENDSHRAKQRNRKWIHIKVAEHNK